MEHFNTEIGAIKQLLLGLMAAKTNPKSHAIMEMESSKEVQKQLGSTSTKIIPLGAKEPLATGSETQDRILDPVKINPCRGHVECPCFDCYDFLGWRMKVE